MNKNLRLIISIVSIAILTCSLSACQKENTPKKYSSIDSAIKGYISDYKNIDENKVELGDYIIGEMTSKNISYYVIHNHIVSNEISTEIAFLIAVHEQNDKYFVEKESQDVSLNNDVNDPAPDVSYTLDVDEENVHFAVGKIYDNSYKAYLDGDVLELDRNGIYCVSSEKPLDVIVTN